MTSLPTNQWDELHEALTREANLAGMMRQTSLARDAEEWRNAREDALLSIARLPDPRRVAAYLETGEPKLAEGLRRAYKSQDRNEYGSLRVPDQFVPCLFSMGIVAAGGPYLTAFGIQVHRALLDDGGDND